MFSLFTKGLKPMAAFFILNDQPGFTVEINGSPLSSLDLNKHIDPFFETNYLLYGKEPTFHISILKNGLCVYEAELPGGTYVVNATDNQWVSMDEITYDAVITTSGYRLLPSRGQATSLPPQRTGVYLISKSTTYPAYGFSSPPHQTINFRRGENEAFKVGKLRAGKL